MHNTKISLKELVNRQPDKDTKYWYFWSVNINPYNDDDRDAYELAKEDSFAAKQLHKKGWQFYLESSSRRSIYGVFTYGFKDGDKIPVMDGDETAPWVIVENNVMTLIDKIPE